MDAAVSMKRFSLDSNPNAYPEPTRTFDPNLIRPYEIPDFERRDPLEYFYVPVDCPSARGCNDGQCPLAHSKFEKMFHPIVYKSQKCDRDRESGCEYNRGPRCSFFHDYSDLTSSREQWKKWEKTWNKWRSYLDSILVEHHCYSKEIRRKALFVMTIRDGEGFPRVDRFQRRRNTFSGLTEHSINFQQIPSLASQFGRNSEGKTLMFPEQCDSTGELDATIQNPNSEIEAITSSLLQSLIGELGNSELAIQFLSNFAALVEADEKRRSKGQENQTVSGIEGAQKAEEELEQRWSGDTSDETSKTIPIPEVESEVVKSAESTNVVSDVPPREVATREPLPCEKETVEETDGTIYSRCLWKPTGGDMPSTWPYMVTFPPNRIAGDSDSSTGNRPEKCIPECQERIVDATPPNCETCGRLIRLLQLAKSKFRDALQERLQEIDYLKEDKQRLQQECLDLRNQVDTLVCAISVLSNAPSKENNGKEAYWQLDSHDSTGTNADSYNFRSGSETFTRSSIVSSFPGSPDMAFKVNTVSPEGNVALGTDLIAGVTQFHEGA